MKELLADRALSLSYMYLGITKKFSFLSDHACDRDSDHTFGLMSARNDVLSAKSRSSIFMGKIA